MRCNTLLGGTGKARGDRHLAFWNIKGEPLSPCTTQRVGDGATNRGLRLLLTWRGVPSQTRVASGNKEARFGWCILNLGAMVGDRKTVSCFLATALTSSVDAPSVRLSACQVLLRRIHTICECVLDIP